MKRHNYKHLFAAVLLFLGAADAGARHKVYNGQVKILSCELDLRGDSLYVAMRVDITGSQVESQRMLDLVPVIKAPGGNERELPSIKICGRNRYKAYMRELAIREERPGDPGAEDYAVIRITDKPALVDYYHAIPFEEWMRTAWLDLNKDMCGCAGATPQVSVERIAERIVPAEDVRTEADDADPGITHLLPKAAVTHPQMLTSEAHLNFPIGEAHLLPGYDDNAEALRKIGELIGKAGKDNAISLRQITLQGYASPEGTFAANQLLSEARAVALRKYLSEAYGLDKSIFRIIAGGEDWEGVEKAVEASGMEYKQEVTAIIRNVPVMDGREVKLMELKGGKPYRHLRKVVFPALRRVAVTVEYRVDIYP